MPKTAAKQTKKKTKRIVVGTRVQLKADKHSDGRIDSKVGKAKWMVTWGEGPHKGKSTTQSSKSLQLWRVDLAAIDAANEDSEGSEEEEEANVPEVDHAENKRKFEAFAGTLVGTSVEVSVLFPSSCFSTVFHAPPVLQVEDRVLGTLKWTFNPRGSKKLDYFPGVVGPIGVVEPTQIKVLKNFVFRGERGDSLRAWLHLYPGNIEEHVSKIGADMKSRDSKAVDLTLGEYVVFHGLFIAASVCVQRGHELWDLPLRERRFRKHPEFGQYMSRRRFDAIKSSLLAAFGDPSKSAEDAWWAVRPLIDSFNDNRRRTVEMSEVQVPDEAMSPFQPRTTKSADLPHLSFVERKPKKLGTEMKCTADGGHGTMRFLEIQEGAEAMARKRHRETYAPATAQALRLVEGAHGWDWH